MLACDCENCLAELRSVDEIHVFPIGMHFLSAHCPGIINGHSCLDITEHPLFPASNSPPYVSRGRLLTARVNERSMKRLANRGSN